MLLLMRPNLVGVMILMAKIEKYEVDLLWDKIKDRHPIQRQKQVYAWVKTGHINFSMFNALLCRMYP